jgi:hypothetical protein
MGGTFDHTLKIFSYDFITDERPAIFILKLDPSGNPIWGKTYKGGNGVNLASSGRRDENMVVDEKGNIYLTGSFSEKVFFDGITLTAPLKRSTQENQFFLTKITSLGNAVWATTLNETFSYGYGNFITIDKVGNVYVSYSGKYSQVFISKFNHNGHLVWNQPKYGMYDYVADMVIANNGNIYVIHNGGGHYGFIPILVKFDSTMHQQWAKCIGTYYGCYHFGAGLFLDHHENIYAGGSIGSDYCHENPVVFENEDCYWGVNSAAAIVKFKSTGEFVGIKTASSKTKFCGISTMAQDYTGNLYVSGQYNYHDYNTINKNDSLTFGNTTLLNDGDWAQTFIAKSNLSDFTLAVKEKLQENLFELFPNPSSGKFFIQTNNQNNVQLTVRNELGMCVWKKDCSNRNTEIDLTSFPKGMYFVEIVSQDERVVKKVVLK